MPWTHGDLTTPTHAPAASDQVIGFTTSLLGQGRLARVIYVGLDDNHVHELSLSGGDRWEHTDLTAEAAAPPASGGTLVGYSTDLGGQGPVARVVYYGADDNNVHELSSSGGAAGWRHTDLTTEAQAPEANGTLAAYTTDLRGQGPVARVVHLGFDDSHVHELRLLSGGRWTHTDLSAEANAPGAAGGTLTGYSTDLGRQGPVARVVYVGDDDNHVQELSLSSGRPWRCSDLTAASGAPPAFVLPAGFTTNLGGRGPVARVVYWNSDDLGIHELSLVGGGHWTHGNLTPQAHAPAAREGRPLGYTTSLAGQGPVARVVYVGADDNHVQELSLAGGGRWRHTDLTDAADAPVVFGSLWGYTTSLDGQGPVARVVYVGDDQHVHELFTFT
jgi:hypothetical protein